MAAPRTDSAETSFDFCGSTAVITLQPATPVRRIGGTTADFAGFTNRQRQSTAEAHGTFPYAQAARGRGNGLSHKADEFLADVRTLYEVVSNARLARPRSLRRPWLCMSNRKTIADFRAKPVYAGDHTQSKNLAYAVYASSDVVPKK